MNRIVCKGEAYEADLVLDLASEVYNLREGDKFTLVVASTLRLDGEPDDNFFNQDGKVCSAFAVHVERGSLIHTFL